MKISVISSCTGMKSVSSPNQLSLTDFQAHPGHRAARQEQLQHLAVPAGELYTGDQHVRLMRGVRAARARGDTVNLWIVSAGYGVVAENDRLAPCEATFNRMKKMEARDWAEHLGIFRSLHQVLATPSDLALILLGHAYLAAIRLDRIQENMPRSWAICCKGSEKFIPAGVHTFGINKASPTKYSIGMVALKGEIAARILGSSDPLGAIARMNQ